jgi:hypothetical protein
LSITFLNAGRHIHPINRVLTENHSERVGNKMGLIDNIKRIIKELKSDRETGFMSEEEIIEDEQTEYESTEDEDQSAGEI